jgi:phospholipid/cholesterol/gamma-HCH transport system substrate-binding protein
MLRSRAIREGTVGLFALLGLAIFGGLALWLRGGGFGQEVYNFTAEFTDVSGLQVGAIVRYRGVAVGKIAAMQPSANGVDVTLEISSPNIILPKNVRIQTNRYGLIGEASLDITPLGATPSNIEALNPLGEDCNSSVIVCEGDRLKGDPGVQLFENLARLSDLYSDPKFFNSITGAAQSASAAADRVARLSDTLSRLSLNVDKEIQGVSDTTESLTKTADETSRLVSNVNGILTTNRSNLQRTLDNTSQLTNNLNSLLAENRTTLNRTLSDIDLTNKELRKLVVSLRATVENVNGGLNASNTERIVQNLETLVANASETSANLRDLSATLNDPTTMTTLQQTLDSARVTFENAQKITSDLDALTGDPSFRNNLRDLVNGLSNLVSSSEQLEQQVATARSLSVIAQETKKTIQAPLRVPQRLNPYQRVVSDREARKQLDYQNMMPQLSERRDRPKTVPSNSTSQVRGASPEDEQQFADAIEKITPASDRHR